MTLPIIFFGHGSPLNALEDNNFTRKWREVISKIPIPKSILVISAHWQTQGSMITGSKVLRTIHDFAGFPEELMNAKYPAKGDSELAKSISNKLRINIDYEYGLDHGAWSVLKQVFPEGNVPILQLSLDYTKSIQEHFDFAKQLAYLRKEGVLIIGSGNIVHNLGLINWNSSAKATWAQEFLDIMTNNIKSQNYNNMINYAQYGLIASKSIPTKEHYLPFLYIAAISKPEDKIEVFCNEVVMGSLSMTCVKYG